MNDKWVRWMASGFALLLAAGLSSPGLAGEAETKPPAPAKAEKAGETPVKSEGPAAPRKPAAAKAPGGLVGTVIAAVPASRTLVVDVPLGKQVLRVGAAVTEKTKITASGAPASFDSLKEGARVRITIRRIDTGVEATSVEVLGGRQG